jgi:hypothetical protein
MSDADPCNKQQELREQRRFTVAPTRRFSSPAISGLWRQRRNDDFSEKPRH